MTKITGSRVSSASQLTDPSKYLLLGQQGSLQIILRRATNLDSIPLNIDQNTYRLELILPGSIQPVTLSELQQILWSLLTELYTEGLSKVGSFFLLSFKTILYSTLSLARSFKRIPMYNSIFGPTTFRGIFPAIYSSTTKTIGRLLLPIL